MPLGELIVDFYDQLKIAHAGLRLARLHACERMQAADLVKLDILVNGAAGRCALDDYAPRRRLLPRPRAGRSSCAR